MEIAETNPAKFPRANWVKPAVAFGLSGFFSGLCFAWLTSLPALQNFWFIKGDKFLIPTNKYWLAFSLLFLLGLIVGYSITLARKSFYPHSAASGLLSTLIIAASAPALHFITREFHLTWNFMWNLLLAPLLFVTLLGVALCIFVQSFRHFWLAVILNILAAIVGFVMVSAIAVWLINGSSAWYDFVQWPIIEAMLVGSCGPWLMREVSAVNKNTPNNSFNRSAD